MSLTQLSALYLPAVEDEMRAAVGQADEHLREYYAMLEHHLGWGSAAGAAGKRIRPLLCLLVCEGAGGQWRQALPVAAAIELIHNFSLIHDDIQDNSLTRRGRPTVWALWGPAQAINAGDALFALAHLAPHRMATSEERPEILLGVLAELDRACLMLTQGQHLDMAYEQRKRVTVAEYFQMVEGKTAALLASTARLGSFLAEGATVRSGHFYQYGRHLGLAFQVQDDLLGIWGDPASTGKSAASDLAQRKKSLPVVYALEHSEAFAEAFAAPAESGASAAEMAQQLEELGAREHCQQMARELTEKAYAYLEAAAPQGEAGQALEELTRQLLDRTV